MTVLSNDDSDCCPITPQTKTTLVGYLYGENGFVVSRDGVSGNGDNTAGVVGPLVATPGDVVIFDRTTGDHIADSGVHISNVLLADGSVPMTGDLDFAGNGANDVVVGGYAETPGAVNLAGGVLTLNRTNGNDFAVTVTEAITSIVITPAPDAGTFCPILVQFTQDATGHPVSGWPGGVDKTVDETANSITVIVGYSLDGGATWVWKIANDLMSAILSTLAGFTDDTGWIKFVAGVPTVVTTLTKNDIPELGTASLYASADFATAAQGVLGAGSLQRSGGTMSGNINLFRNAITDGTVKITSVSGAKIVTYGYADEYLTTDEVGVTWQLPNNGVIGQHFVVWQGGAGQITFTAESGATVAFSAGATHTKTARENAAVTVRCVANPGGLSARWIVSGATE